MSDVSEELLGPATAFCLGLPRRTGEAVVVGVNGPQGAGKSTLVTALVRALGERGERAIGFSVDDVYLPRSGQLAVAAAHPGDRVMEHRGAPGTHDVALGVATLEALRRGEPVAVPRYDKAAFAGRGDRAPVGTWSAVSGDWDVVLFEGWMLGFRPVPDPPVALTSPNVALTAYEAWNRRLDAMILLRTASPETIVGWRVESEAARRARGEAGLTDAAARDYIERFLPFYQTYVGPLWANPPGRAALRIELAADRRPAR